MPPLIIYCIMIFLLTNFKRFFPRHVLDFDRVGVKGLNRICFVLVISVSVNIYFEHTLLSFSFIFFHFLMELNNKHNIF